MYNRRGGRPRLNGEFKAVCDAVLGAWQGDGQTITDVAARFEVSRGWVYKHVYPVLDEEEAADGKNDRSGRRTRRGSV